jgi:hypothetical protein
MISERWAFIASTKCYAALLSLYPVVFRVRFGGEMIQVFQDCCRDQLKSSGITGLAKLWLRTLIDCAVSIPRERRQALLYAGDLRIWTGSLVDSIVLMAIIGFHLLLAGTGIALSLPHTFESPRGFLVAAGTIGAALGGLGVLCSLCLARFRRVNYRFIGL